MKVKIYGAGCGRCVMLEKVVEQAIKEIDADIEVTKISDIDQIIKAGILAAPGLAIGGEVKSMGRVPSNDEIKKWIKAKM